MLKNARIDRSVISVAVLLLIATALTAWQGLVARQAIALARKESSEAQVATIYADKAKDAAEQTQKAQRVLMYSSDMYRANQYLLSGNLAAVREILSRYKPSDTSEDLRGIEWTYMWNESHKVTSNVGAVVGAAELKIALTEYEQPIGFGPTDDEVLTIDGSGTVHIYCRSGAEARELIQFGPRRVAQSTDGRWSSSVSNDGRKLAFGMTEGSLQIWSTAKRTCLEAVRVSLGEVNVVRFHPVRSSTVAMATSEGLLTIRDSQDIGNQLEIRSDIGPVTAIRLAREQKLVALSTGNRVRVYDYSRGVHQLFDHHGLCQAIEFSLDGDSLWVATEGNIVVLDSHSGCPLSKLSGHAGRIDALTFSPDARTLITAGNGQSIRFWNLKTGTEMGALRNSSNSDYLLIGACTPTRTYRLIAGGPANPLTCVSLPSLAQIDAICSPQTVKDELAHNKL